MNSSFDIKWCNSTSTPSWVCRSSRTCAFLISTTVPIRYPVTRSMPPQAIRSASCRGCWNIQAPLWAVGSAVTSSASSTLPNAVSTA